MNNVFENLPNLNLRKVKTKNKSQFWFLKFLAIKNLQRLNKFDFTYTLYVRF